MIDLDYPDEDDNMYFYQGIPPIMYTLQLNSGEELNLHFCIDYKVENDSFDYFLDYRNEF